MRDFIGGAIFAGLVVLIMSVCAFAAMEGAWKRDAVIHGAASYTLNPTNGTSVWKWNK